MNKKIAYKVCRNNFNKDPISFIGYSGIKYPPEQWVHIPGEEWGPLCVFETLEQAKLFIHQIHNTIYEIWECEIIEDKTEAPLANPHFRAINICPRKMCPPGTIFCTSIKLLKKMTGEDHV